MGSGCSLVVELSSRITVIYAGIGLAAQYRGQCKLVRITHVAYVPFEHVHSRRSEGFT